MSSNDESTPSVMDRAKETVMLRFSSQESAASQYFGPPAFCAGAALAAYSGVHLEPTASLIFGTIGMTFFAQCICSIENGEYALLRSFVAGFVSSGVFRHFFF